MAITTRDQLISALGGNFSQFLINKASVANQTAGRFCSLFRATGLPGQGAIPTTAALCDHNTLGAIAFTQQTAPALSYIGYAAIASSLAGQGWEIHDRIAHIGGFNLNITTPQTVTGFDLQTLAPSTERLGASNFSDVTFWLEVYADGGATAANATITVTFDDGSSGTLSTLAVGGTIRAGNCFNLDSLRTGAQQARRIRAVTNVTLSAATGVVGNFGFTVRRFRTVMPTIIANKNEEFDWARIGFPQIPNGSCLELFGQTISTASGTVIGGGKIVHG